MVITPISEKSIGHVFQNLMSCKQCLVQDAIHQYNSHFSKEGAANSQTVPDLDTFLHADFTETWTKLTVVTKPSVNIDASKLLKDLQDERELRPLLPIHTRVIV